MCGGCGRTAVPDPVLGKVRTTRQHLIVAHTVNAICTGQSGVPKVTALSDGWLLSGPSGSTRVCHTVEDVWAVVIGVFTDTSLLSCLLKHQQAYADDPDNEGLPARTARMGSGLTALAVVSTPAKHPRRLTPGIPPTRGDAPQ
jgi:hypothetical protein